MKFKLRKNRGFSLLEMIIYLGIMSLILIVIVRTMTVIIASQKKAEILGVLEHSAVVTLDRISREVRDASNIDYVKSQSAYPTKIVLDTTDDSGNPKEVEFYIEDGSILLRDGAVEGPLTDPEVEVTEFSYLIFSEGTVEAVRVKLALSAGQNQSQRTETFYLTTLLRHGQ